MNSIPKRGFTLPGESGYEDLTLSLAKRWGADVIRDSDGTTLSPQIIEAGYDIYSTLCIIREHNDYLRKHPEHQQQCFLMSEPVTSKRNNLCIPLLQGYFKEQFSINASADSLAIWQVFNRTTGEEVSPSSWDFNAKSGCVTIKDTMLFCQYTVNFLAYRTWEEISMYNHVTNAWTKDHLMQIDPVYPEAWQYLLQYMQEWCLSHPDTTVVRFTSLFYNFAWIWGNNERNRSLFTDWASYDFSVSPLMLHNFEKEYGYALTSEDFINRGLRQPCHMEPSAHMLDYISFINDFVITKGKQLVDITHQHGKKAYLFYDDSWVGTEPGSPRFKEFGFDGIIKCVFSGYEARLCSTVKGVDTHELRLHPYLFPVGLGNTPTFSDGGHPGKDALVYWVQVRRALLRQPVDRIGLGGYLHLIQNHPDFITAIDQITDEFAQIQQIHNAGKPLTYPHKIAILSSWGNLRRWTCGGHYHEHPDLDLLNLLESLSGMPFNVAFYRFDELHHDIPEDIDIIINAGFAGSAWSGGSAWNHPALVQNLTRWVDKGGIYFGVNQPSANIQTDPAFRMSHILGVDSNHPALLCHGKWQSTLLNNSDYPSFSFASLSPARVISAHTQVVQQDSEENPIFSIHPFGKGSGVYLSAYRHTTDNSHALHTLLLQLTGRQQYIPISPDTEHHIFSNNTIIFVNNTNHPCSAFAHHNGKRYSVELAPYGMKPVTI